MGIDTKRFVNLTFFGEELLCAICHGVLEDPLSLTRCGHSYCKQCILRWIKERKTCPVDSSEICRLNALIPTPLVVKNILGRHSVHCDYKDNGCETVVTLDSLNDHCARCKYRPTLKHRIRRNVDHFICSLLSRRRQESETVIETQDTETVEPIVESIYYDSFYQRERRNRELAEQANEPNERRIDFTTEFKLLLIFFLVLSSGCILKGVLANLTHFYYENEIVCWLTLIAAFAVWRNQQHLIPNYI
ncbi:E3 ubiquitin-protein ligase NRDP1-like isoform X2 [Leptotrombidium deliense]|uniref:E3 ubiquitin-protein ligase NRDP1-like isoform X2 n=1 Tax=Leptotrombidium deliense TaxID=299467 RepID=A0A443STQ5_9ACAR|nr:E3 ubiquitin-protein ligase NRDP1-like isoform X2 [Leptotrombidium deliense]